MKKRVLSVFLSLVMVIGMFGVVPTISVCAGDSVKSKLDSFISSHPSGSRWTSSFDGGIQCYGFGKLVIYNLFGKNGSSYRSWKYDGTPTSGMTVVGSVTNFSYNNVKSLLSKAKVGDILQFNTTKQHTMIVYSVESDGVYIYDCNWDNNCGISKRKSSFGAWSGRNSSKLTLLRSSNYPNPVTHKVDTSYGKNFTAYPKAKITASNILNADHTQMSSTAWIGTSDKCTIHEVYTDGCCKVTYPISSGTITAYCRISLFNIHTHNYTGQRVYESAHPHAISQRCVNYASCGGFYWTGENKIVSDCTQCKENSKKASYSLTCSSSSVTMKVGETRTVVFTESSSGFPVSMPGQCNTSMLSAQWGEWVDGCKRSLTFKALKVGTTQINVQLVSSLTGDVVKTYSLPITIVENHTHSYTSTVTKKATCTEAGVKTFTCSCGKSYTESIPAVGHQMNTFIEDPRCEKKGYTIHWCQVCDYMYDDTYVPAKGHNFGSWSIINSATCTTDGTKERTCSACGKTETSTIAKTGHSYTTKVVNPTCTNEGYTLHTCSKCSDSYRDTYTNAKGHSFGTWSTTKLATCTTDGTKTRKCSSCGKNETQVVPKAGHSYSTNVVAPTCTEQGYTLHICSNCNYTYEDTYTNVIRHSYTIKVVKPTYLAQGYTLHTCSICGASYKDNYTAKLKLAKVSGLKGSGNATTSVKLSWSKVSGATGYYVYQQKDGKWSKIKTTSSTSYTVSKLKAGKTYKFAIKAYKTVGDKKVASEKYSSTLTTSTLPEKVSFTLKAGSKKVTVKWNKVTGATGYRVYYKTSSKGKWTKLKTVNNKTTSYTKTGLTKGKRYYFTVKAYKTVGGKTYNGKYATKSVVVK